MPMTATAYARGHKIFSPDCKNWFYADTKEPFNDSRACKRCKCMPTKEGHDACLGALPGVKNACCGHGREEDKYVSYISPK